MKGKQGGETKTVTTEKHAGYRKKKKDRKADSHSSCSWEISRLFQGNVNSSFTSIITELVYYYTFACQCAQD